MPTSPKTKITLVGECNPYGNDPEFALYPAPDGCSGHRLCCLILGMRRIAYLDTFHRTNLCAGDHSPAAAMTAAAQLLSGGGRLVLLGSKVCRAFGVAYAPFTVADEVLLRLPHPSGLCRTWNEPGAVGRARAAVLGLAPEPAPLLGAADEVEGNAPC